MGRGGVSKRKALSGICECGHDYIMHVPRGLCSAFDRLQAVVTSSLVLAEDYDCSCKKYRPKSRKQSSTHANQTKKRDKGEA